MEISRVTQGGVPAVQPDVASNSPDIRLKAENRQDDVKIYPVFTRDTLTKEEAKKTVDDLNHLLSLSNSHLQFVYHEKLKEYYVTIVDNKTNEVIKEIPPKKMLDLVAGLWERIGIIVNEKI